MPHKWLDTPRSDVSCNRTPWHLISSYPRYRSHQCNNELGTRKTKAALSPPPPTPHSVTTCLINIYHRHRVRLRLFISRSQEVNKGDNSLDRTKQKWHNKKEREINELSYHSTKGFPRIERVFPRTWVAAYISSASRLEWQSNIVEAISYEFIYNWKDGGSVTSKTHLNCTSQKYSDELCLLIDGKLKLIPGVRPGDLKCWAHAIMNIFKSSKRDSFMKETWSDWWTFCHESIFPWLLSN